MEPQAAPHGLHNLFPAVTSRLASNQVNTTDGNAPNGLLTLQGDLYDARWAGNFVRLHYCDAPWNHRPLSLPEGGAPINVRTIFSFAMNAGGDIVYH
jgi:hypothetical protein